MHAIDEGNEDWVEDWVEVTEMICAAPEARRELLWLRACERGDAGAVADLERVDPRIALRLEALARAVWSAAGGPDTDDPRTRRALYQWMQDERLRHHVARLRRRPCECVQCGSRRAGPRGTIPPFGRGAFVG